MKSNRWFAVLCGAIVVAGGVVLLAINRNWFEPEVDPPQVVQLQRQRELEEERARQAAIPDNRQALASAGFTHIDVVDRNDWYKQQARLERDRLKGTLYDGLSTAVGETSVDHEIDVWDKLIVALDQGQLRPTHLRGKKPE